MPVFVRVPVAVGVYTSVGVRVGVLVGVDEYVGANVTVGSDPQANSGNWPVTTMVGVQLLPLAGVYVNVTVSVCAAFLLPLEV